MNLFGFEQHGGDESRLDGRLTVYARVDLDPVELMAHENNAIYSMVHNGFLVAQGNYREMTNLKEFLIKELGADLEAGLDEFVERLDGIEGALDPAKLKEKLENLDELNDFIPTPARIVPFGSERDIRAEEGDIYFVGSFKSVANANLCVNAIPILYQARFREQEAANLLTEIESLIAMVETGPHHEPVRFDSPGVNVASVLLKDHIPRMLYSRGTPHDLEPAIADFRAFLVDYPNPSDVDAVERVVRTEISPSPDHYRLVELLARRIDAVTREDMRTAGLIAQEILALETRLFGADF